jgi:hypothetical protein
MFKTTSLFFCWDCKLRSDGCIHSNGDYVLRYLLCVVWCWWCGHVCHISRANEHVALYSSYLIFSYQSRVVSAPAS